MEGLHEKNGMTPDAIAALQTDLDATGLPEKERALLRFARALTIDPPQAPRAVPGLLAAGWTEQQVADTIFIVSAFNMLTRIAAGFALPPDANHPFTANDRLPMTRCSK